jgi:two-component system cell cycle response regulator
MYAAKARVRPTAARQASLALSAAVSARHPEVGRHTDEVAELAAALARELGLDDVLAAVVREAAELHDVGKLAYPESLLGKPDDLDDEEWRFIRRHPLVGERMLLSVPDLRPVAPLVRASHERWDGGGYPDGLVGEAIPLGARIVAVCDAFDAMVSGRPYQRPRDVDAALLELERCAGSQFDPAVVAAFVRVLQGRPAVA